MSSYTRTHTNHLNDTLKKYPLNIPWDTSLWDISDTNNPKVKPTAKIDNELIRQLRQHSKALEYQFNLAGTDPTYEDIDDDDIADGKTVEKEQLFSDDGSGGLINGLQKMGLDSNISSPQVDQIITKDLFDTIATNVQSGSKYSNYSNYNNSGYGQYMNYGNYANQTDNYNNPNRYYNRYNKHGFNYYQYARTYSKLYHNANWDTYVNSSVPGYTYANNIATTAGYDGQTINSAAYDGDSSPNIVVDTSDSSVQYSNYSYSNSGLPNPGTYNNGL